MTRATHAIACDPECQRERTSNELREKYFNAKTNLMTAPNQVNVAAKNYYTFVKYVSVNFSIPSVFTY